MLEGSSKAEEALVQRPAADKPVWSGTVDVSSGKKLKTKEMAVGLFSFALAHKKTFVVHHFLDVTEVNHPEPNTLVISFANKPPLGLAGPSAHAICKAMLESYDKVFFGLPSKSQWTRRVRPDLLPVADEAERGRKKLMGGFSELYRAYCGLLGTVCREDIAWDIDNVLHANRVTVFDAREFEQPTEAKDLVALFKALQHNMHFRELCVAPMSSKARVEKEPLVAAAEVFLSNCAISHVSFTECSPNLSLAIPVLSSALSINHSNVVTVLSLGSNGLDDKDISTLAAGLAAMEHGLACLSLADNNMTKKGAQALAAALQKNTRFAETLQILSLSQNKIGADGSAALAAWLGAPNNLRELFLRDANAAVGNVAQALVKGSQQLEVLDVSWNKFVKGAPVADVAALLSSSQKLRVLSLASTVPSTEQLKEMLRALALNAHLDQVELDISGNALGVVGANLLAIEMKQFLSLVSLSCADNGFKDKGLSILCESLCENDRLQRLDLSDNFDVASFRKSKATSSLFVESLGNLVTSEKCALRELRVCSTQKGTQMKGELSGAFFDLGLNKTVTLLDVSGQGLEYGGFVGLTRMLQINKKLERLVMDDNGIDLQCVRALSLALDRNATLMQLPLPINDVAQLLSKADASGRREFAASWAAIEAALHRNHEAAKSAALAAKASPSKKAAPMERVSNVRAASMLFDRGEDLEKLRFAIRVAPQKELSAEQKGLLGEVDNHHQVAVTLAGMRGRALDRMRAQVAAELQKVAPIVLLQLQAGEQDLSAEVGECVRKAFHSSLSGENRAKVDAILSKQPKRPDLKGVLVDPMVARVEDLLEQATTAQLKQVADVVQEALLVGMRSILEGGTADARPVVAPIPVRVSTDFSSPQSPRLLANRASGTSPRSAAEVLRKFSNPSTAATAAAAAAAADGAADAASGVSFAPVPITSTTPEDGSVGKKKKVGTHSRSKSHAAPASVGNRLKSPRGKKLSMAESIDFGSAESPLGGVLPSNALVTPGAMESMLAPEDQVEESAKTSGKNRRRRRPRGPSSFFAQEDLVIVHEAAARLDL